MLCKCLSTKNDQDFKIKEHVKMKGFNFNLRN